MTIFDLDDITNEKQALLVANGILKEGIEAANAMRRKRQKIKVCMAKIKMLNSWCLANKWTTPIVLLKKAFTTLEDHIAELDVNLWGI